MRTEFGGGGDAQEGGRSHPLKWMLCSSRLCFQPKKWWREEKKRRSTRNGYAWSSSKWLQMVLELLEGGKKYCNNQVIWRLLSYFFSYSIALWRCWQISGKRTKKKKQLRLPECPGSGRLKSEKCNKKRKKNEKKSASCAKQPLVCSRSWNRELVIGRRKEEGCAELNREDEFTRTHMHAHTHSVKRNPKGG